jgi:1,4-dihydroxy-2-naphthoyl-CoA synthase
MPADRTPAAPRAGRTVRVDEPAPGVRVITLDRPQRLNAMSGELISDLHRALDDAAADEAGRLVVTTFTRDHREQITAFVDKRPPHYTNE